MKKKVMIIGSGMMGMMHGDALLRIPEVELSAIVDPDRSAAKKTAGLLGVERVYTDYETALTTEKPDIVHICTPNHLHFPIAQFALNNGIGVYCEKPLALTKEEGEALMRLAEEKRLPNAVNFNYRNNVMVRDIHERILSNDAGSMYFVHGHYLQDWLMYSTDYSWRLDEERNGKSRAIADIGSHWFDTVQFATGKMIRKIYCKMNTAIPRRIKPNMEVATYARNDGNGESISVKTEDIAMILLQLEDGTPGSLILSQVSGGHKNDLQIEIDCANYAMKWEQENADKLYVSSRNTGNQLFYASAGTVHGDAVRFAPTPEGHAVAWRDALYNGIREFYQAVDDGSFAKAGRKSYATFKTGTQVLSLVEACLQSNEKNCWVEV